MSGNNLCSCFLVKTTGVQITAVTRPTFILGNVEDSGYSSPSHSPVPPCGIKQLLKEALMFRASCELDANARVGRGQETADSSPNIST